MIDCKNRYGFTAARIRDVEGRAGRPFFTDHRFHVHIVIPEAAMLRGRILISAEFHRSWLSDLDRMGIDIKSSPAPRKCYYSLDLKIAQSAHRLANDGVAESCTRKPGRFLGLGVVTLQQLELARARLRHV
jgi:aminocarboxymuconate-semialdehyde decarboxylase